VTGDEYEVAEGWHRRSVPGREDQVVGKVTEGL
jgi:hypothetical protein